MFEVTVQQFLVRSWKASEFISGDHSQQDEEFHFCFMAISSAKHEAELGFRVEGN